MPGATIKIKGTSLGTATNMEGKFELTVVDNFIALEISFVGYETVEVTVGKREYLDVLLKTESSNIYRFFSAIQGRRIEECRKSEFASEFESIGPCFCCVRKQ